MKSESSRGGAEWGISSAVLFHAAQSLAGFWFPSRRGWNHHWECSQWASTQGFLYRFLILSGSQSLFCLLNPLQSSNERTNVLSWITSPCFGFWFFFISAASCSYSFKLFQIRKFILDTYSIRLPQIIWIPLKKVTVWCISLRDHVCNSLFKGLVRTGPGKEAWGIDFSSSEPMCLMLLFTHCLYFNNAGFSWLLLFAVLIFTLRCLWDFCFSL